MQKIAVIQNAGAGTMLLRGVYGTLDTTQEGSTAVSFRIAPEFTRVSHLFSLLDSGTAPIDIDTTKVLEAEDDVAETLRNNLMHKLAIRWAEQYDRVGGLGAQAVNGASANIIQTMLKNERAIMVNGARSHLLSQGVQEYEVTVQYEGESLSESTLYRSKERLISSMQPVTVDGKTEIVSATAVSLGTDNLAREPEVAEEAETAAGGEEINQQTGEITLDDSYKFSGFTAKGLVTAKVSVVANSPETAISYINAAFNTMREDKLLETLTVKPVAVENLVPGQAVTGDFDDDFEDEEIRAEVQTQ